MPLPRVPVPLVALLAMLPSIVRADEPAAPKPPPPRIVGDDAPPLKVGRWVKGEPVENLDRGRVYVLDFWAPQLGACKVTIPHLSSVAAKFPAATFIGVCIDPASADGVADYVRQLGDKATYRFAVDAIGHTDGGEGHVGAMYADWLEPGELFTGQPLCCIVDADGTMQWIGSPMRVEAPLAKILAGTFDRDAARKEAVAAAAREERRDAATQEIRNALVARAAQTGSDADAYALREKIYSKYPETHAAALDAKFNQLLLAKKYDEAYAVADEAAAAATDQDAQLLNGLAWAIVDNEGVERRDLPRAHRYADRAVALTDGLNGAILDTLAKVVFLEGDVAKAIELQTRAIEYAGPRDEEQLRGTLLTYQAQLQK